MAKLQSCSDVCGKYNGLHYPNFPQMSLQLCSFEKQKAISYGSYKQESLVPVNFLQAQGLANKDITSYLNTLGFRVPGYMGPALSIFWTGFVVTEVFDITSHLSDQDPKFFTSFNILPAAVMNDVGGTNIGLTSEQRTMFWAQFSTWMATTTTGKFAFWLTGGTPDGFFPPCGNYPRCYFEQYELPNLQVEKLVVLHLPGKRSTASASECANDRRSYEKLIGVNFRLLYYCCELPAVDESSSLDNDVFNRVSEIAAALQKDSATVPDKCLDLQKQFPSHAKL